MKILITLLFSLNLLAQTPSYDRKEFRHWDDEDRDCRNRRAEVLKDRSLESVTYRKSRRGLCTVKTGKWNDFYFDEVQNRASMVDIDHVVPLKNAWDSGAHNWSKFEREQFANDPLNLVITNRKYNRQKGAQTPLTWAPIDRKYYCKYLLRWIKVKQKYELLIEKQVFTFFKDADCRYED